MMPIPLSDELRLERGAEGILIPEPLKVGALVGGWRHEAKAVG